MNITRIGFCLLIVGLILFMSASSSHVSGHGQVSYDNLEENQTQIYTILIAPVGPANMAIGEQQPRHPTMPEGFYQYQLTNVSVHVKVTDPNNNTLIEKDIITPYYFDIDFKTRGSYTVYVTNRGTEKTSIPVSVIFELHNPQNKEADKFLLSIILTALGGVIVFTGFALDFALNHRKGGGTNGKDIHQHILVSELYPEVKP